MTDETADLRSAARTLCCAGSREGALNSDWWCQSTDNGEIASLAAEPVRW
jgi:hypothetical protein